MGGLTQSRPTAFRPAGTSRIAPVQTTYKPSVVLGRIAPYRESRNTGDDVRLGDDAEEALGVDLAAGEYFPEALAGDQAGEIDEFLELRGTVAAEQAADGKSRAASGRMRRGNQWMQGPRKWGSIGQATAGVWIQSRFPTRQASRAKASWSSTLPTCSITELE